MKTNRLILTFGLLILAVCAFGQRKENKLRITDEAFFRTAEARRIGEQVLAWQRNTGGWPKNIDMAEPLDSIGLARVLADKGRQDDSTTDNNATSMQMYYLARLYQATGDVRFRNAFRRGVDYLLSGQYDNGGWPQFWPQMRDYQIHITFNDDAMVNTMNLLRSVARQEKPFGGKLTDRKLRQRAQHAFDRGVDCILRCQIVRGGEPTVWCQQHDRETFAPAKARAFELPSFCSSESASIVRLLMGIDHPSEAVRRAVRGAMRWFDTYKLTGYRVVRTGRKHTPECNTFLVRDSAAAPMWARFYDLDNCQPFVCDRDGIPRRHLEDIGQERRSGYKWFDAELGDLYTLYNIWAQRWDADSIMTLELCSPGANERGLVDMDRPQRPAQELFDVVVRPGQRIQTAIEQAPDSASAPFKILILKGTYHEKVIIDKPHIVLVGEQRDSTIIEYAETAASQTIKEYRGRPVHQGVVVLQEGAVDCVISGLTIYDNYGSTVEPTTTHQMAVFGRATRTIIVNSTILSDGNDALSLWAKGGGLYYHADLTLRCPGVDFFCPRGTCYATRCQFVGDSRAIIWHDGSGDKSQKLVITNSSFDAKSPTKLGRYHHDHQFYLVNCHLSANILDSNISYAYTDKVLDPCPWGQRVYYYDCQREGGHSGWLRDNLDEAEGSPAFHAVTARWTFGDRWDPEAQLRQLWDVVRY